LSESAVSDNNNLAENVYKLFIFIQNFHDGEFIQDFDFDTPRIIVRYFSGIRDENENENESKFSLAIHHCPKFGGVRFTHKFSNSVLIHDRYNGAVKLWYGLYKRIKLSQNSIQFYWYATNYFLKYKKMYYHVYEEDFIRNQLSQDKFVFGQEIGYKEGNL
jgi:hypothetical protein